MNICWRIKNVNNNCVEILKLFLNIHFFKHGYRNCYLLLLLIMRRKQVFSRQLFWNQLFKLLLSMPNALLLPRRQDCKLSGQQFLLERRNAGIENRETFPQSHQFVLLIEDQGPFHVELPGHQELDRGRPRIPFETHFGMIQV